MNTIPRISSFFSEPWMAWVMLFLLICLALIYSREPSYLKNLFYGYMSQTERSFGDLSLDFVTVIVINIYKMGILAMTVYLCLKIQGDMRFLQYLLVVAIVSGVTLLKRLIIRGLTFIFEWKRSMVMSMEAYNGLWMLVCLLLYPLLLVMTSFNAPVVMYVMMAMMLLGYVVLLAIRLVRSSMRKPLSVLYIVFYVLTIEVLPVGGVLMGVSHLIRIQ